MDLDSAFGRRLRDYREDNNLTREQLAERCDISDKCVSRIELGRSDPKLSTVLKLCQSLDLNVGFLSDFYPEKEDDKNGI